MRTDSGTDMTKLIGLFAILQTRFVRLLIISSANAVHHKNDYVAPFSSLKFTVMILNI
jgi:hypothetical protein